MNLAWWVEKSGYCFSGKKLVSSCPLRASLVAQTVKNLPAMPETRVLSLGEEDPLEEGMATHSSILVGKIPWTESLLGYSPWSCKRVRHNWTNSAFIYYSYLAWRIPGTEELGGLQSIRLQRVGHDWGDLAHVHVCPHTHTISTNEFFGNILNWTFNMR